MRLLCVLLMAATPLAVQACPTRAAATVVAVESTGMPDDCPMMAAERADEREKDAPAGSPDCCGAMCAPAALPDAARLAERASVAEDPEAHTVAPLAPTLLQVDKPPPRNRA